MSKWNLIVDVASCTNCNVCVLACHDEHVGNSFPGYAEEMPKHGHQWIKIEQKVRGEGGQIDVAYLPVMCQHCDDAPCMEAAENGAITKRADGIVLIDPEKSKGQRQIVDACPYGAVYWNEEKQIPQHWIFDAHLIDQGWKEPRAAQVCATAAIKAVKVEDAQMVEIAREENLQHFHPEYGTRPRVWYKNLHRFTKCFVAGSLTAVENGQSDCVGHARVSLRKGDEMIAETVSDGFGDFKFDGLDGGEDYRVEIESDRWPPKSLDVSLGEESLSLGSIELS